MNYSHCVPCLEQTQGTHHGERKGGGRGGEGGKREIEKLFESVLTVSSMRHCVEQQIDSHNNIQHICLSVESDQVSLILQDGGLRERGSK